MLSTLASTAQNFLGGVTTGETSIETFSALSTSTSFGVLSITFTPQKNVFNPHQPTTKTRRPTMPFSDFVKPPPHTPFTRDFFYSLTFDGLADVRLPVIAPSGNVLHWIHSSDVPTGDTSFRVDVEDFVPHVDDLQEILSSMEREFDSGSRSVYMSVRTVDGLQANFSAHYGKVRFVFLTHNECLTLDPRRYVFSKLSTTM